MSAILISNGEIINEGQRIHGYILIEGDTITEIGAGEYSGDFYGNRIDAGGRIVMPGVIDVHVHFREPGLTQKGDMASESAAAVAGGVTSVFEMPNTQPLTTSVDSLEQKFELAEGKMVTNYSFFLGANNENFKEIKRLDPREVCGVKLFMGSSTGNMLVESDYAISTLFAESPVIISAHCEDETTIRNSTDLHRQREGEKATAKIHPSVRSEESCYRSSARAIEFADKYSSKLHIAHLTTERELSLLDTKSYREKLITAEACIPHLWFCDKDYARLGNLIKCNPSIKTEKDRDALRDALSNGRIDIVATDHAPHMREEKERHYWDAPSGIPMVQHSLVAMGELVREGIVTLEKMVERMCHAPAVIFSISKRGFLRKGYKADIVIVDLDAPWRVERKNILCKCGWSPLDGEQFNSKVYLTLINGRVVYENGNVVADSAAERLHFDR